MKHPFIPEREGRYEVLDPWYMRGSIDVYEHPIKGLSIFEPNLGESYCDDKTDCHISVQNSGITFGKRLGECTDE